MLVCKNSQNTNSLPIKIKAMGSTNMDIENNTYSSAPIPFTSPRGTSSVPIVKGKKPSVSNFVLSHHDTNDANLK
eukprot:Pgem_evm1s12303